MTIVLKITAIKQQTEIDIESVRADTFDHEHAIAYLLGSYAKDLFRRPASETITLAQTLMRQDRAVQAAADAISRAKGG